MSIPPCIFGPVWWTQLHLISFNYPEIITNNAKDQQIRKNVLNFMKLLGATLPCENCSTHYYENINKPIHDTKYGPMSLESSLESRDKFSRYIYNLHELVNKQLGKVSNLTYEDVYNRYSKLRSEKECGKNVCGDEIEKSGLKTRVEIVNENFETSNISTQTIIIIVLCIIIFLLVAYFIYSTYYKGSKPIKNKGH